jgi:DNA repair exonuclease SbcCD ATPase subunit
MIGIITHVAALAERVPVRFIVSHTGATSTLCKEGV